MNFLYSQIFFFFFWVFEIIPWVNNHGIYTFRQIIVPVWSLGPCLGFCFNSTFLHLALNLFELKKRTKIRQMSVSWQISITYIEFSQSRLGEVFVLLYCCHCFFVCSVVLSRTEAWCGRNLLDWFLQHAFVQFQRWFNEQNHLTGN